VRTVGVVPVGCPSVEALEPLLTGVAVRGDSAPLMTLGELLTDDATTGLAQLATGAAVRPPAADEALDGMTDVNFALVNIREADCC
jgi:hypothetical protein